MSSTVWERLVAFWAANWDVHPDRAALLAALAGAYALALALDRQRGGWPFPWGRAVVFSLGLAALGLAVASPLHHLSDRYLFSAHMLQHLLLTLVAPPLMLLGIPRRVAPTAAQAPWLARFGRSQLYPVLAFGSFNAVFAFLHFPTLYDAIFADEVTHFLAHGALLIVALVTWLPLFSPAPDALPRLSLPGQMLYCFLQTIPGSLVGSLITLSERTIYRHYGAAPEQLGLSPLADQQLGGLFMWVIGGGYFLVLLTVLFFVWADQEERKEG